MIFWTSSIIYCFLIIFSGDVFAGNEDNIRQSDENDSGFFENCSQKNDSPIDQLVKNVTDALKSKNPEDAAQCKFDTVSINEIYAQLLMNKAAMKDYINTLETSLDYVSDLEEGNYFSSDLLEMMQKYPKKDKNELLEKMKAKPMSKRSRLEYETRERLVHNLDILLKYSKKMFEKLPNVTNPPILSDVAKSVILIDDFFKNTFKSHTEGFLGDDINSIFYVAKKMAQIEHKNQSGIAFLDRYLKSMHFRSDGMKKTIKTLDEETRKAYYRDLNKDSKEKWPADCKKHLNAIQLSKLRLQLREEKQLELQLKTTHAKQAGQTKRWFSIRKKDSYNPIDLQKDLKDQEEKVKLLMRQIQKLESSPEELESESKI